MRSSPGSATLLRAARDGSTEALDELFRTVSPQLLAAIRLRLGPDLRRRIESQDVLQATLLKAFLRLEQFEGSGSRSLSGWLTAIARNEIRDQLDHRRRNRRDDAKKVPLDGVIERLEAKIRSEVSRIHLREQELRLEAALESLEPDHREVIVLRKYEELTFPEVAARMERSPDACRMLFARAMAALTRRMTAGHE